MFPKARPECPLMTDFSPIVSSGKLVPAAIMVAPITVWGIPIDSAIPMAESTRKLALNTTPRAPIIVNMTYLLSLFFSAGFTSSHSSGGTRTLDSWYI